jgi:hypothetical protein
MALYISASMLINSLGAIPVSTLKAAILYKVELRSTIFFLRLTPRQSQDCL